MLHFQSFCIANFLVSDVVDCADLASSVTT